MVSTLSINLKQNKMNGPKVYKHESLLSTKKNKQIYILIGIIRETELVQISEVQLHS